MPPSAPVDSVEMGAEVWFVAGIRGLVIVVQWVLMSSSARSDRDGGMADFSQHTSCKPLHCGYCTVLLRDGVGGGVAASATWELRVVPSQLIRALRTSTSDHKLSASPRGVM